MLRKIRESENGDILVLFAGVIIILIMFLALSTDVILAYSKKDKLVEIGNLMKDARFDLGEELWNADVPQDKLREISWEIAKRNGLTVDQMKIEWTPVKNNPNIREAKTVVTLTDEYECTTLKMLGIDKLPIKVVVEGSQVKYGSMIWSPGMY